MDELAERVKGELTISPLEGLFTVTPAKATAVDKKNIRIAEKGFFIAFASPRLFEHVLLEIS